MPASHKWEIDLDGQTIEASKAEIKKLEKSAKASGTPYTVFENGQPVSNIKVATTDTFKHVTFVELSKLGYRVSSLTKEFDNGMTDLDLREEIGDLLNKFEDLYKRVDTRINEQMEQATYGPFEPSIA